MTLGHQDEVLYYHIDTKQLKLYEKIYELSSLLNHLGEMFDVSGHGPLFCSFSLAKHWENLLKIFLISFYFILHC